VAAAAAVLAVPLHHPVAAAVHLPSSGELDVIPVGFTVADMAVAALAEPPSLPLAADARDGASVAASPPVRAPLALLAAQSCSALPSATER